MSTRTLRAIQRLVSPFMLTTEIRPHEDGPTVAGYGADGAWHDFLSIDAALQYANQQHYTRSLAQEGKQ